MHYGDLMSATVDVYYQIGTSTNCAMNCLGNATQDPCIDLSGIGSNYLAKIPYDPTEGSDATTAYAIMKDSNGAISLIACLPEGEGPGGMGVPPDIRVVR